MNEVTSEAAPARKRGRILYFDLLTIFACFAVVVLHCNLQVHWDLASPSWAQSLAAEVLFYWAVPIFFMLTGANNIGYRAKYSTKDFLLRRMRKLVVPFVAWSALIYLLYHCILAHDASLAGFWSDFITCNILDIYWFFPAIISLTLAMPVVSLLKDHLKLCWYVVGVSFVLVFLTPPVCTICGIPWSNSYFLPVAAGFVTYAVLGHATSKTDIPLKQRCLIYALAVACLVFRYAYIYIASHGAGEVVDPFNYNTFVAFFPAQALFLAFKHIKWPRFLTEHSRAVAAISGASFGIYLIHLLLIRGWAQGLGMGWGSHWLTVVGPFVVYAVCLAVVLIIKRIPVLRELVP